MTPRTPSSGDRRAEILALMLSESAAIRRQRRIRRAFAVAAVLILAVGAVALLRPSFTRPMPSVPQIVSIEERRSSAVSGMSSTPSSSSPAGASTAHQPTLVRSLVDPSEPTAIRELAASGGLLTRPLVDPAERSIVRVINDDELLEVLSAAGQCASIVRVSRETTIVFRDCGGEPSALTR